MNNQQTANHLSGESSPYLKQHMYNPVDWYPWGEKALAKARNENKLLIISIGYSACHWCHVMERESFEDEEVAEVMNKHFVSIKIDREERPDLDHFYMDAMQVLNGNGGWPLNVFAMADGRPFYGGTYFYRDQWMKLCSDLARIHLQRPFEIEEYTDNLTKGVESVSGIFVQQQLDKIPVMSLRNVFKSLSDEFDQNMGGLNSRNKFPMPVVLDYLLRYYFYTKNTASLDLALLTLNKMSEGGIYDHIGGGFARYSTDKQWKVPHFEKMLYDNAQLISVYTDAFRITADARYKEVVYQTIDFVKENLTSADGGFYSALDADSEGEEGRYYVWTKMEFESLLTEHGDFLKDYFGINERGAWEEEKYVLYITSDFEKLIEQHGLSYASARYIISNAKIILKKERDKRIKPGLDDKILCSWNALMLKALANAYAVFGEQQFIDMALKNYNYIRQHLIKNDKVQRYAYGKVDNIAFMDDYAGLISALIALYRSNADADVLLLAKKLTEQCIANYFDPKKTFFSFTQMDSSDTPVRKYETIDNVIPSSNAVMAENLLLLSAYFGDHSFKKIAEPMILNMFAQSEKYPSSYALWSSMALLLANPYFEVAVIGEQWQEISDQLNSEYLPNMVLASSRDNINELPLFLNRFREGETLIYICKDHVCLLPETDMKKVLADLKDF
jgi:uncharacterized protein YyaL (SSP411 family)